ncbi:MAG TPA: TonB-dependent receptor, partial [Intrasporangium sp.]|nr:TonB-dependent receptor [Intrasporangium sp.]
ETPVVDPERVSVNQNFDQTYLEEVAVGSANRGYQDVLFQAPGVGTQTGGGSNPSVFGSTYRENAYYLDGSNTTDPVTLTFGSNLTFDAIQEMSFHTGGFEAEYGNATGGVINVITKSGGNDLSGTLDVRYADPDFSEEGEHFDPDASPFEFTNAALTLGGPILRDKAWFFGAYERPVNELQPSGGRTARAFDGDIYLGKITYQATPSWSVVGQYSADPATIENAATPNSAYLPEAQRVQEQGGDIAQVYASGVLGPNALLDVRATRNRQELNSVPMSGDIETPGFQNISTGLFFNNYTNAQFSNRDRDEYRTSLTYYLDDFAGSHELKGGVEYADLTFSSQSFFTGDFSYTTRIVRGEEIPRNFVFSDDRSVAAFDGETTTAYLQDGWSVTERVRLNLGVRWDEATWNNNFGQEMATLDKVQPRLGFTWDAAGNGKTIVRGHWGQFMHPASTRIGQIARVSGNTPTITAFSCEYVRRFTFGLPNGSGVPCEDVAAALVEIQGWEGSIVQDRLGLDPDGWIVQTITGAGVPSLIDPNLEPMYAEETILSVEREILPKTSVELTYVDKETNDIFEDTCVNHVPGQPTDIAGCNNFIVTNLPELRRDYRAGILKLESRALDWLRVLGSVTWSESKGSIEATQYAGGDFDVFPLDFQNAYGYTSDDRRWRYKLNGFADLPLGLQLALGYFYSSPYAYNVHDASLGPSSLSLAANGPLIEPRGSRRANSTSQLDLGLTKGFQVGPAHLELIATVYNALDEQNSLSVCEDIHGCASVNGAVELGEPLTWAQPRNYEAGLRVTF